jgi:hypothetical protein
MANTLMSMSNTLISGRVRNGTSAPAKPVFYRTQNVWSYQDEIRKSAL